MEYFPAPLEKLTEQFARLPGIGGKSAQRLAFFVLGLPQEEAEEFAEAILTAKRTVMGGNYRWCICHFSCKNVIWRAGTELYESGTWSKMFPSYFFPGNYD